MKRLVYRSVALGVRACQRALLDLQVSGREHLPAGPALFVMNHISALDPIHLLPVFPTPVRVVAGPPYAFKWPARIYDAFDQINAMPARRRHVVDEAVSRLRHGHSVLIAPEGDLQDQPKLGRFYPGAARIYRRTAVPMVPVALVAPVNRLRDYPFPTIVDGRVYRCVVQLRGPMIIQIGEPMRPQPPSNLPADQVDDYIMKQVRNRMAAMIDEARPDDSWLQPR